MKTSFDVAVSATHFIQVSVPGMGDVTFPAGGTLQLFNASKQTIEYFRSLYDLGFKVEIGKVVSKPFMTYNYDVGGSSKDSFDKKVEEERAKAEAQKTTPLQKVSNYIISRGANKGKRVCDVPVKNLKAVMNSTTDETLKSVINTYLNLTNQN
jgi:hypothetical protein|nr:MAG TPA: hypothetical protein [Caudoviricetes sp.]